MTDLKEKLKEYPVTDKFKPVDVIIMPHPYCITPKHLETGRMYLDGEAIEEAEKKHGAVCDICRIHNRKHGVPVLSYSDHRPAMLIEVNDRRELKDIPELHGYLLSIKERAIRDGFTGFAFKQRCGE